MSDKRKKTNEKRGGFELGAQARQYQPRVFRANIGENAEDAGNTLRKCAISAKFGKQSHLHIVGDSAPWTAEQMDDKSARKPPISFRFKDAPLNQTRLKAIKKRYESAINISASVSIT